MHATIQASGIDSSNIRESVFLRIAGDGIDFDELTQTLGLMPSRTRRKGEFLIEGGRPAEHDAWVYRLEANETTTLDESIQALHDALRSHGVYVRELKKRFQVTVECSWRFRGTNANEPVAIGGIQIAHESLRLFTELEVPLRIRMLFAQES